MKVTDSRVYFRITLDLSSVRVALLESIHKIILLVNAANVFQAPIKTKLEHQSANCARKENGKTEKPNRTA